MRDVAMAYKTIYGCKVTTIPIRTGEKIHEKLEDDYTSGNPVSGRSGDRLTIDEIKKLIKSSGNENYFKKDGMNYF